MVGKSEKTGSRIWFMSLIAEGEDRRLSLKEENMPTNETIDQL